MKERSLNFICVGAQKSGTTSLHDVLRQHPDLCLPEIKETKFFLSTSLYSKGLDYYYESFFNACDYESKLCEVDPDLLFCEETPKRLFDAFGNELKVLILLRSPVERAFSQYQMSCSRGLEKLSFLEALEVEDERLSNEAPDSLLHGNTQHFSYIARGRYYQQIANYLAYFKRENVKILFFEDLISDRDVFYETIFNYLGVAYEPSHIDFEVKSNVATSSRIPSLSGMFHRKSIVRTMVGYFFSKDMKAHIRRKIENFLKVKSHKKLTEVEKEFVYNKYYKNEVERLEVLLKRDLGFWKK